MRNNFRVCLIAGEGGTNLQRRCREYPAFTKNVNFIWFPHWSKTQLVEHALYHLNGMLLLSLNSAIADTPPGVFMPMQYRESFFFSAVKYENLQCNNFDILFIFAQNINFGYKLEPPRW